MKAIRFQVDKKLGWDKHVLCIKKRIMSIIGGITMIGHKLTQKQTTQIVTLLVFLIHLMLVKYGSQHL